MSDTYDDCVYRTPPAPDTVVIPMEEQHVDRVKTIWSARLGAPQDRIDTWLEHVLDEGRITEGFVASSGGYVLGFAIATAAGEDYLSDYLAHPDSSVSVWPKTGICEAIAVDEEYEHQGIGTELGKAQIRYLCLCDVDGVVAVSWHRDDHHDSRTLFEKLGFTAAETHDEYYATLPEDVYCVDCESSCTCGATVFVRNITSQNDRGEDTVTDQGNDRQ